jgi:hypothetical protein
LLCSRSGGASRMAPMGCVGRDTGLARSAPGLGIGYPSVAIGMALEDAVHQNGP